MKTDIHPKYEKTTIECACGNSFETRSTVSPLIKVELCSACHPFFTGKQKFVDTAGRVDKFRARLEASATLKTKNKGQEAKKVESKSNVEKLSELKESIKKDKPMAVSQVVSSDEEIAAADELAHEKGSGLENNL